MTKDNVPTIYLLDGSYGVTGALVCARNIALALSGKARVVLVLPFGCVIREDFSDPFHLIRRIPMPLLRKSILNIVLYVPLISVSTIMLRYFLLKDRANTLIVNDFFLIQGALCRLLGYRGKLFTWVRIDPQMFGMKISSLLIKVAAISSDKIIAVSKFIISRLPDSVEAKLIYDAYCPPQNKSGEVIVHPGRCLVYIGNYVDNKGQDLAILAFSNVAPEYKDASLHFFGDTLGRKRNQDYYENLITMVESRGLSRRVHLHGFCPDVGAVFRGAFAALNFSASESFSMTVLEAQGAGVPVIATNSGGPAEIVADANTGIMVPVGDVTAMSDAMRQLLANPAKAADMGVAARARVRMLYSPTSFSENLGTLLTFSP